MAIETTTADGLAYWASYLVNGDATGFASDRDQREADAWLRLLTADGWCVVGVQEGSERLTRFGGLLSDVVTYELLRTV